MRALAERVAGLGGETAFDVLAEVQSLARQGRDIVSFAIGEPGFPTPQAIKQAGAGAILSDDTKYAPTPGLPELREVVAAKASALRGVQYQPEEVVITPGAKPILFYGLLALADPGCGVIYPTPCFPVYENIIHLVGARPIPVLLREERGFRFDLDEIAARLTPDVRVLLLNAPGNPCGNVLDAADLAALARLAVEHDVWVIADEIYSRLVYIGQFQSIAAQPGMKERTMIVDGHSKTYAMTGWRLGYGCGPEPLIETIARLIVNSVSCTPPFTQRAGVVALRECEADAQAMRAELARRRELMTEGLNHLPGFHCEPPGGAFYCFPNVTAACRRLGLASDVELQQWLLHEVGVATLHRDCFGRRLPEETQQYLRFSFAGHPADIERGLDRLRAALG